MAVPAVEHTSMARFLAIWKSSPSASRPRSAAAAIAWKSRRVTAPRARNCRQKRGSAVEVAIASGSARDLRPNSPLNSPRPRLPAPGGVRPLMLRLSACGA